MPTNIAKPQNMNNAPLQGSGNPAGPCTMVLFGASGDLTKRKLLPALYNLKQQKLLPDEFAILGFARNDFTTESFRAAIRGEIKQYLTGAFDQGLWDWLESRLYYLSGDFGSDKGYHDLGAELAKIDQSHKTGGNALFYLAVSPSFFATCADALAKAKLVDQGNGSWRRVVVEKPFGRDLASAVALNQNLRKVLEEKQIYRIDHYLGKETVQNIMVFRFGNGLFEPIWNRRYVDHVQITVAETVGVEKRGGYYDQAGALRDMVPNHIFQLISLVAMEPPISFEADAVRDEQTKVLKAMQPMAPEDVLTRTVRGQYGAGEVKGAKYVDYRAEVDVPAQSTTETFVAMKLGIDNWRWNGVPFYLRVGKALAKRTTEIVIQFRRPPMVLFRGTTVGQLAPNMLVINVQPDEGISLRFGAKIPGATLRLGDVDMSFKYSEAFGVTPETGYERLLYDAMLGDQTLFQRADMVEAGWTAVAPVLDVWHALPPRGFPNYAAGGWGPEEANQLLARDGHAWRLIEDKD